MAGDPVSFDRFSFYRCVRCLRSRWFCVTLRHCLLFVFCLSMDLRGFAVVSSDGSFFDASKALLVDTSSLSEGEIDILNEGTDSERWELACARGLSLCSVVSLDQ